MRLLLVLAVAATPALATLASPARATDVRVHVTGIGSDAGRVRVAVCPEATFLKDDCPYRVKVPARRGSMDVMVANVPPGTYAAYAHHDINANDEVDQNFLGIPTEGIGFSRAPSLFHKPRFAESALVIGGALVQVDIALRFEP